MMFTGIHHPALVTGNLDTTIRFWRDLLGMRLVYTLGEAGNRQVYFAVTAETLISFFEWPGVEPIPYRRHGQSRNSAEVFDHLAIAVATEEALWELAGLLESAEAPVSDLIDHGFVHSLYTYDPNGIPLEFLWPVPGNDVVANPRFMDLSPTVATLGGPDPVPGAWPVPEPVPDYERFVIPGEGMDHFEHLHIRVMGGGRPLQPNPSENRR